MLVNSCLQFLGYEVNSIHFEILESFGEINEFRISPSFAISINEIVDGICKVQLSASIKNTAENPQPFNLDVNMTGNFIISLESDDEDLRRTLLHDNTAAIMFPFLRSIIASLTTTANIPPLLLPVINIAETFKKDEKLD